MSWSDDETGAYGPPPIGRVRQALNGITGTVVGFCWIHLLSLGGLLIALFQADRDSEPRRHPSPAELDQRATPRTRASHRA
jgi:hypothetical protein